MNPLRASAEAKLNLALTVVARRADGFHELRSVFVRLAFHDDLSVAFAADPDGPDELVVSGDAIVPIEGNLVLLAAARLRAAVDRRLSALAFTLHKRIPTEAGLAGGSSDAATALELARRAWGIGADEVDMLSLALGLGADVPFFATGAPAALVSGIGDEVEPLSALQPPAGVVLVTPRQGLSTAAVFGAYDAWADAEADAEGGPPIVGAAAELTERLAVCLRDGADAGQVRRLLASSSLTNDLWPASAGLSPELGRLRRCLGDVAGEPFHMTGSGSTLFMLASSFEQATATAEMVRAGLPSELEHATVNVTSTAPATADIEGATA